MGSFFQSFAISTLCLSLFFTGSNADLIKRQGLSPPAILPDGWSYKGCYTYDIHYPSLAGVQGVTVALEFLNDRDAGTRLGKDPYQLPHLQVVARVPTSALTTVPPQGTL